MEVSSQQQATIDNSYTFNTVQASDVHAAYGDRFVSGKSIVSYLIREFQD